MGDKKKIRESHEFTRLITSRHINPFFFFFFNSFRRLQILGTDLFVNFSFSPNRCSIQPDTLKYNHRGHKNKKWNLCLDQFLLIRRMES